VTGNFNGGFNGNGAIIQDIPLDPRLTNPAFEGVGVPINIPPPTTTTFTAVVPELGAGPGVLPTATGTVVTPQAMHPHQGFTLFRTAPAPGHGQVVFAMTGHGFVPQPSAFFSHVQSHFMH
jgi:hypothetical protein